MYNPPEMGLIGKLKELSQNLARLVFSPERVQRLVQQFNEIGIKAEIEWMPPMDLRAMPRTGSRVCLGKLNVEAPPISRFEAYILRTASDDNLCVHFEHHYVVDLTGAAPAEHVRAKRVPQHRYWLFGPVIGHRWRGGHIGERLEADTGVNRSLDDAGLGPVTIEVDRNEGLLRMIQPLTGRVAAGASLIGIFSGAQLPKVVVADKAPTTERVSAMVELARAVCHHLKRLPRMTLNRKD